MIGGALDGLHGHRRGLVELLGDVHVAVDRDPAARLEGETHVPISQVEAVVVGVDLQCGATLGSGLRDRLHVGLQVGA